MIKFKHGRHTSTFVLLFLAEESTYGLDQGGIKNAPKTYV